MSAQPRADAIAARLDAAVRPFVSPQQRGALVAAILAALAPADLQHEHYGEACPACAAEATPADPTADLRAAAQRLLDRFDGPFGNSPSRDEIEALRAALAPADQTADLLQRLDKQPRWYDQRTDQDVIAWRDVVSALAAWRDER